jgi:hypothetical protein
MRRLMTKRHRTCGLLILVLGLPTISNAHHPERETQTPHQRIDAIGPLGNRFPASYRRVYNRPTYLGGKIAYWIAPSSQEAIAWHKAEHLGAYKNKLPRIENTYFYPKPWEAMRIGQRVSVLEPPKKGSAATKDESLIESYDEGMASPVISVPLTTPVETLETSELPVDRLETEAGEK